MHSRKSAQLMQGFEMTCRVVPVGTCILHASWPCCLSLSMPASCNRRPARCARCACCADEIRESDIGTGAGLFEVRKIGDEFFTFIVDCKVGWPATWACV